MKLSEMREKTADELQNAIVEWKKQLLESRLKLSTNKLEDTSSISKTKRLIAQAKTIIKEKGKENA
ncbi:50S ribosomal protein L29 [bacterium]|jgi:large subunit ribosomal protein L29|nr:50S ribosomal protein L29 [bacterium]